jgi:hypothetical protein
VGHPHFRLGCLLPPKERILYHVLRIHHPPSIRYAMENSIGLTQ